MSAVTPAEEVQFVPLNIAVLTVSDTRTEETDKSGQLLVERLQGAGHKLYEKCIEKDNIYKIRALVARCLARGVELKWFGAPAPQGFTSSYASWGYADPAPLPETDRILAGLLDMRLPLTFSEADCALIGRILRQELAALAGQAGAA